MKIIVITGWIFPDAEGGSFRVAYDLAKGMADRGHEIIVITRQIKPEQPLWERMDNMEIRRYQVQHGEGLRLCLETIQAVRKATRGLQADAVHLHHLFASLGANLSPELATIPKVMTFHMARAMEYRDEALFRGQSPQSPALSLHTYLLQAADLFNLRKCSRIVTLSDFMKNTVTEMDTELAERCVTIPGGVDTQRFNTELPRAETRCRLGLSGSDFLFFTVRRLEPRMGLDNLITAFSMLPRESPARLLIGGKGSLAPQLHEMIAHYRLEERVRLLGFIPQAQLPWYYRAANCTVMPTRALEGFGITAIESLACGTPVIATPVGGMPEIIKRVDESLLTQGVSPEHLHSTISQTIAAGTEHLQVKALAVVRERYDLQSVILSYETLFENVT